MFKDSEQLNWKEKIALSPVEYLFLAWFLKKKELILLFCCVRSDFLTFWPFSNMFVWKLKIKNL